MKYKSYKEIIDSVGEKKCRDNKRILQNGIDALVDAGMSMLEIAQFMSLDESTVIEDMNQTMKRQSKGTRQYGRDIRAVLGRDEHCLAIYIVEDHKVPTTQYGRMVVAYPDGKLWDMYTGGTDRHKVEDISVYDIDTQKEIEESLSLLNEKLKQKCKRKRKT
jgi:hypothetical protein